ncbi:MAG: TIGR00730 family Rossman fold protein [Magnetospirillum sp. WYHS-4]
MTKIASLCVFSGSKKGNDPAFAATAEALGREMARRGTRLVYGGGDIGLMSVLARAVLAEGGQVMGVIPEFLRAFEVGDPGVQELIVVGSMHERKAVMFDEADGFVVLPGGLGTLDEMFEILTWKQLQQHAKPVVVVDVNGYWEPLKAMIARIVDGGFGHHKINELLIFVATADQVWDALASAPKPDIVVLTSHL